MDLVVLRRLTGELAARVVGQRIDRVYAVPRYDVAVVVASRGNPRIWFSAEPTDPHLYLRPGGHDAPARPPAFAMAARKWARGQRIRALRILGDDRVVELALASDARLIFELVPRRACAFVLEPDGTVAAVWNPRRGRPGPGERWSPPSVSERTPIDAVPEPELRRIGSEEDPRRAASGLMRAIEGMTPLIAGEIAARRSEQRPFREIVASELRRAAEAPTEALLYAPGPPDSLSTDPGADRLLVAPYPLERAAGLTATPYPDLVEAAAALYGTRARVRRLDAIRDAVTGAVRSRLRTLARTRDKMATRRSDPEDAARFRRRGDLLLAAPGAEVVGGRARVPDLHGDGSPIEIEVDPALDLVENAQRYYRQARRAARRVERQRERAAQLDAEKAALEDLAAEAAATLGLNRAERVLAAAEAAGLDVRVEPTRMAEASTGDRVAPPERPRRPRPGPGEPGVRRFRGPGGMELLVGRSAAGNDRLTHRLAAREDWWLHALGPGSHVVLRNPGRQEQPPAEALRAAATLAAWFSRARGAIKCEVHWTRVRDVKRPRGAAPGRVTLTRHQTLLVEPRSPEDLGLEEL